MKEMALNAANDIFLGPDGSFVRVSDAEQVVQHVRSRLQFIYGEWDLDTTLGIPYFDRIFRKPVRLDEIETTFKTEILETPGVLKLNSFFMEFTSNNRVLEITFTADTKFGNLDPTKVYINK